MRPLTASASSVASGLQANPSACGSLELTALGLAGGDGVEAVGVVAGEELAGGPTEAMGTVTSMGSITGPWSGRETATMVPSGLMAMGPSSGPSFSGNACRTLAFRFSQYHRPVPKARTPNSPLAPGAAPSVNSAVWSGGLVTTLIAGMGFVRSIPST